MRHGLYVAPFGELADVRALAEVSAQAEAGGWDGFFVWDHVMTFDRLDVADPWIALTAVALATERLRLGAMVTPLARRRPWDVARQVAVLDRLSGGRMVFGAGLGGDSRRELTAFGEERDPRARAALLDEALDVVVDLWTGEPVSRDGPAFVLDDARRCARRRCSSRARRCGWAACGPTAARSCARRATTACSRSATRRRSPATTCAPSSRPSACIAPPAPRRSTSWSSTTSGRAPIAWPSSRTRAPPGGCRASASARGWPTCGPPRRPARHNDSMSEGEAITAEGLEALKAELAHLEGDARRDMAKRIMAARELGDLKENAEYHIAKEDQAHLETKIKRLVERLRNAVVVDAPTDNDVVAFGTTVTVADEQTGREATWTLVGATEADLVGRQAVGRVAGGQGAHGPAPGRRDRGPDAARRAPPARRAPRQLRPAGAERRSSPLWRG